MDQEFDEAVRILAQHQLRHDVRNILLSIQQPSGDFVVSLTKSGVTSFRLHARVDRATHGMVRFRRSEG